MSAQATHHERQTALLRNNRLRAFATALAGFALFMILADTILALVGPAANSVGISPTSVSPIGTTLASLMGFPSDSIAAFADVLFGEQARLVWIAALGLSFVLALHATSGLAANVDFAGTGLNRASDADSLPESELARLAFTDELTGVANRRGFDDRLGQLLDERQSADSPFAVGLIDLDGFKPINDIYGLPAGDDILRQVGLRLQGAARDHGFVSRFGNDDFAIIAPDITDANAAREFGRVLSEVLGAPFDLETRRVRLSASIGMAMYPEASASPDKLVEHAGSALYQAKRGESGKVVVYSKELEARLNESVRIEQALRRAISDGVIQPHYQPIVSLADQKILGFEALARWTDPELGSVSPAVFIPIAEQRGLIGEMTEVLLFRAAREARFWPDDTFLSFNLSTTQLSDPGTALKVLAILSRAGLDPRRLEVEITETALMSDTGTAKAVLDELRQTGVRVALDDFGTGYSSLGYLRELDLDKVKIDRTFVADMGRKRQSDHIIKAILEMCTGLDLAVVAEGIEEIHQVKSLREIGCHAGQGYYFGKPMNAQNARELFNDTSSSLAMTIH